MHSLASKWRGLEFGAPETGTRIVSLMYTYGQIRSNTPHMLAYAEKMHGLRVHDQLMHGYGNRIDEPDSLYIASCTAYHEINHMYVFGGIIPMFEESLIPRIIVPTFSSSTHCLILLLKCMSPMARNPNNRNQSPPNRGLNANTNRKSSSSSSSNNGVDGNAPPEAAS